MIEFLQSLNPFHRKKGYAPLNPIPLFLYSRLWIFVKIGVLVLILLSLAYFLHPSAKDATTQYLAIYGHIPSIVHYIYIKRDSDSTINMHFAHFLSLYASVMYIKPSKIYLYTDYNQTEIQSAIETGNMWTRKVFTTFPNLLQINHVRVPQFAGSDVMRPIEAIQHKSDVLRWEEVSRIGGIYIDWDVVPLKSLTPLQNAGFAFVAGRQYGGAEEGGAINGTINNGAFLTKPNSALTRLMVRGQMAAFNGAWAFNLQLLTQIAERLVSIPNEVLILDRNAFAPTHWFQDSKDTLFKTHGTASPEPITTDSTDPIIRYDTIVKNRRTRKDWEMDFSATYLLHAFGQGQYNEWITPKKILSRTSNYGVATWPIVKKMVADGLVAGIEDSD